MPENTVKPAERRAGYAEISDKIDTVILAIDKHIASTEENTRQIAHVVEKYFGSLEAHEHRFHHDQYGDELVEKQKSEEMWAGIRKSMVEKAILVAAGSIITYFAVLLYKDAAVRINTYVPPAHYRQFYNSNQVPSTPPNPSNVAIPETPAGR